MISDVERAQVKKLNRDQDRILATISGIIDDIFILELYARYYPCLDDPSIGRINVA